MPSETLLPLGICAARSAGSFEELCTAPHLSRAFRCVSVMAERVEGQVLPADLHEAMGMHGDNWRSVRRMVGVSRFFACQTGQNCQCM